MASCTASNATATRGGGGHLPFPAVSLRSSVHLDPISVTEALLETGVEPAQAWPVASAGHQALLYEAELLRHADDDAELAQSAHAATRRLIPSRIDGRTSLNRAAKLTQEALRLQRKDVSSAPLSAIRVHARLFDLIAAAQRLLCNPGWFLDPSQAVFVCANQEELEHVLALMRQPMVGQGSDEDPLAAAQWVAENLMAPYPGWKFGGALPVRLASEIGPEDSFREVILSPRCWELLPQELLPTVRAARVGLHTFREGGEARAAAEGKPGRQWDWAEQDRKQDRRLAAMACFRFPGTAEEIPKVLSDAENYRANLRAAEEVRRARQARLDQREADHLVRVKLQSPA